VTEKGQSVDGWRNGRPSVGGFWDEDSAYWIDGMTRLGLVLHDNELIERVKQDFDHVLANPSNFHNTFKGDVIEGWVRSIYSRGMLAYYSGTGDERLTTFLATAYKNYTAADSIDPPNQDQSHQGSRSMTQVCMIHARVWRCFYSFRANLSLYLLLCVLIKVSCTTSYR
jgi:hypothetical protein